MKATITGHDELSIKILADLEGGLRVSDVPAVYPVSLDQAKRLSRFRHMLAQATGNLEDEHIRRLKQLGLKSLPLAPYVKRADWGGVAEILAVITDETKREEIQLLLKGLEAKRTRVAELKEEADLASSRLEESLQTLHNQEQQLLHQHAALAALLKKSRRYKEPFRSFLQKGLGFEDGSVVLVNRLNEEWRQMLSEKGILADDVVTNLDQLVEELILRHERGLAYQSGATLANRRSLLEAMDEVSKSLEQMRKERAILEKELQDVKTNTVQSYMDMTEVSGFLSALDLKHQNDLRSKALRWLFKRGYVALGNFTLPNEKNADILAYSASHVVILSVKVSEDDLRTDQKWTACLPYCDEFYFLTPATLADIVEEKIREANCGQCIETEDGVKVIKPDERPTRPIPQAEAIKYEASRWLSRKAIFGY